MLKMQDTIKKVGKRLAKKLLKTKNPLIINRLKRGFVLEAGLEPARP